MFAVDEREETQDADEQKFERRIVVHDNRESSCGRHDDGEDENTNYERRETFEIDQMNENEKTLCDDTTSESNRIVPT